MEVERQLHEQIPLSAVMGVRVLEATAERVRLAAPLAPNVNHMTTLFGGSGVAVATLCAWTLLHLKLEQAGRAVRVLIQRSVMDYERPITADFEAVCVCRDEPAWQRFRTTLERRGRARIGLTAQLLLSGQPMATFHGDFVALSR
jgi:thioesterase domain-containing protein